jgi:hypothetical protein
LNIRLPQKPLSRPSPTLSFEEDDTPDNNNLTQGELPLAEIPPTAAARVQGPGPAQRGRTCSNGSIATLLEVVAFYNRGGQKSDLIHPLSLTEEQEDMLAFLKSLSGKSPKIDQPPPIP